MKVFYKMYFNGRWFDNQNEQSHLIIYAYKKDGAATQIEHHFNDGWSLSENDIIEIVKERSPQIKDYPIEMSLVESETLNPLFFACVEIVE